MCHFKIWHWNSFVLLDLAKNTFALSKIDKKLQCTVLVFYETVDTVCERFLIEKNIFLENIDNR